MEVRRAGRRLWRECGNLTDNIGKVCGGGIFAT